jgi:hypothetical protein
MALMHLWRRPMGSPTSDLDFYLGVRTRPAPKRHSVGPNRFQRQRQPRSPRPGSASLDPAVIRQSQWPQYAAHPRTARAEIAEGRAPIFLSPEQVTPPTTATLRRNVRRGRATDPLVWTPRFCSTGCAAVDGARCVGVQ